MTILDPHEDSILAKQKAGFSCSMLAREYEVSYVTMWKFLKARKVAFRRKLLSPEQELEFVEDYRSGMRQKALGLKYDIDRISARNYIIRHDLKPHPQYRLHQINGDFFKTLTHESLWVLGWFYSDGNVAKDKNAFSIVVHNQDEEVLLKIRHLLRMDTKLIAHSKRQESCALYGCHSEIKKDLISLGCIPAKSLIIRYPAQLIEDWQHWVFLRGVWEGDGSIGFKSKSNRPGLNCELASGSLGFLQDVAHLLKTRLNIDVRIKERPNSNSKRLMILGGREPILRFLDLLYENGTTPNRLERKFNIYQAMKASEDTPHNMHLINRDRLTEGYFMTGDQIYYVRGVRQFADEIGTPEHVFFHLLQRKDSKLAFKPRRYKWIKPTDAQIATARTSGTLISKHY